MKTFTVIAMAAVAASLAACEASAPAEESPVAPSVVCDEVATSDADPTSANGACATYNPVVTNEAVADGNDN